ncbi:hypothetical protein FWF74_04010 [Candidatus Saccharibacteria bacterium]|nr:hypothetical protein [Candidatus Saccharibacteria bacterium]MCL1962779.1 hypothetical protein [Candidatus Saccharibacteria bacterium]
MSFSSEMIMCGERVTITGENEAEFNREKRRKCGECAARNSCKRCVIMDGAVSCSKPNRGQVKSDEEEWRRWRGIEDDEMSA